MSEKMQLELGRPREVIASEINVIKDQTQKMMIQASSEIGKRLIEAKEQVPHGEWGQWLKDNVDYSQSTANNLMQIHREYKEDSQAFVNLTYTKAVALLGINPEEREAFVEEVKADEISTRELQKLIKEKQQLEAEMKALEEQMKKAEQAKDASLEQMQMQLEGLQGQIAQNEQAQGDSKRLEQELAVANSTVEQLQKDLKAKPIEAAAVVEVVPEEVKKELETLRAKAEQSTDPDEVKFKFQFEALVSEFDKALVSLDQIRNSDVQKKYKTAIHKLLDSMRVSLEEE